MMSGPRRRSAFEIANGLHWVRGEIDASLMRARVAIEDYLEDAGEGTGPTQMLRAAADELRMVRGSLAMIECFGAGLLAQDMLALLEALIEGKTERPDEAFAALSGATLQLSDYVDLLAHGAPDRVLVLQPVLNELRLAWGQPLATEAELFARQLLLQAVNTSNETNGNADSAQALAKRELMTFQTSFLHWFRGQQIDAALDRIGKIADSVAVNAAASELRGFWASCAALAECLRLQSQESLDLKRLFGRAVSQLKLLAESGETAALAQLGDAPQLMLYHIARTPNPGARAARLIADLHLDVLMPTLAEINDLRHRLRGPNTTILHRLYAEIRNDFTQLKDAIDLAVRTHGRSGGDIGVTRERLRRMAQTVGTLGLPSAQATLMNQSAAVAELPPGAPQWVDTAIAILRVEYSLEEALFRALGRGDGITPRDFAEIELEVPHKQDLRDSVAALVRECLVEFAQIKTAVDAYRARGETAAIVQVPQRLRDLSASLRILGQPRAAELVAQVQRYVTEGGLAEARAESGSFEPFADALSSAELFFEALRDGLPNPERGLEDVALYVRRLRGARLDAEPVKIELDFRPLGEAALASKADTDAAAAQEPAIPAPASAPVGEGIDPEIRSIFIEETDEVLQNLQRLLPQLKRNPADRTLLTDVRRAFHTLKGSGRMAGALRIGEFSWSVENLLNRILNGAMTVQPAVLELLQQAAALLPKLVDDYRGGAEAGAVTATESSALIDLAARLSADGGSGEPNLFAVFRDDARERLQFVQRWLDSHREMPAGVTAEPEVVRAFHTLRGSSAVVQAQNIHQLAASLERYLTTLATHGRLLPQAGIPLLVDALAAIGSWLEGADTGDANAAVQAAWQARIDALLSTSKSSGATRPEVDEAFCLQALNALQALETEASQWSKAPAISAASALCEGLNTLATSAQTAGAEPLAKLARAVAAPLVDLTADIAPPEDFFAALIELLEGLYQRLDDYRSGMPAAEVRDWSAQLQRLARQTDYPESELSSTEELELEPAFELEPALPAARAARRSEFDSEPHQTFVAQAGEALEVLDHRQSAWAAGDPTAAPELRDSLSSFSIVARQAGVSAIADLAQQLAREIEQIDPDSAAPLQSRAAKGIETLHRLFGEWSRGETSQSRDLLDEAAPHAQRETSDVESVPSELPPPEVEAKHAIDTPVAEAPDAAPLPLQPESIAESAPSHPPTPALHEESGDIQTLALDAMFDEAGTIESAQSEVGDPDAALSESAFDGTERPVSIQQDPNAEDDSSTSNRAETGLAAEAPETHSEATPDAPEHSLPESNGRHASTDPAPPHPAATAEIPSSGAAHALDRELTDIFVGEAGELLEQLDAGFDAWHKGDDGGALLTVQRALHTLKGGARMSGLEAMGDVAHDLESRVNAVAALGGSPNTETYRSLRESFSHLQRMHDQIRRGDAAMLGASHANVAAEEPMAVAALPSLSGWLPELFWRPQEDASAATASRVETARVPVEALDGMLNQVGEISINRSRLEERNGSMRTQLSEMSQTIVRLREHLRLMEAETDAQIAARGLGSEPAENREEDRYGQDFDPLEMDRFSRMQELSRALAESVNDLAALQTAMDEAVRETESLLLLQSRTNTEVQQGLMGTLMVPFSRQMQRLQRLVQQTAQENGKQADIQFNGADAELDRKVLDRITAPLEHLLRNAVVHGIEEPSQRALNQKPPAGVIHINLSREGGQLLVEVGDDGAGLDLSAIRARATERGLLAPQAQVSDGELARFIFEPGFSTAKALTQDAGRGIGMDVVASEVKQLGGTLELRSEAGRGARFLMRLPLTMAVSQVLMIGVADENYALPMSSIEGIARIPLADAEIQLRADGPLFPYGGRGYRVRHLADYLELPRAENPDVRNLTVILVRLGDDLGSGERRIALVIDQLLGNRDIITKAIGPQIGSIPGVAGATLLADGRVVLILDVAALVSDHARRALLSDAAVGAPKTRVAEVLDMIMVVDDSVTMRRVAERLLQRNGYRVLTARDGLDAIAQLQTETPVTLLLDIEMPRADGFEVASFVRNNPRLHDLPIIMITSRSGEKHRERARQLGVDRYLIKPYQEEQLLAEVKSVRQGRSA